MNILTFVPVAGSAEAANIAHLLNHGCTWHGLLLSDHCCECGMHRFYSDNPQEATMRGVTSSTHTRR